MSSHHRSGGPPSLMDDVSDFDRNFHSHRFDGGRGGRGRGGAAGGGMRGRGGGDGGGMRGRGGGGDGGFVPRGGLRGGRGEYHQRDRFPNNNFNRSDDDQRGGQSKMPSLFDVSQQQSQSFDRDNNNGGGRGRMPFPRGGGGARDSAVDDRYRHSGSKPGSTDGPPPLLDFPNEKVGLLANTSSNSLPSLFAVQVENTGGPPTGSESSKSIDSHKEPPIGDSSSARSDHSSHRDNDSRYRDRDSRKSSHSSFDRSSSLSRDRSRSPRDRDRDRHGPSRDDRSFEGDHRRGARGGRGGGSSDHFGRGNRGGGAGGGHHNNPREPHQSRFGSDNNQPPWQDRREGGRSGGGRGGFQDRPRDIGSHHRPNEQLPPDNHPFHRDGRSNFDGPPPPNRPFQEGFPPRNYDSMGPPGHNRPNFNQGPSPNRPDFYPPNNSNPSYQQHTTRSGGRPSRFTDRQDDYEDERPLTKPNLSLPNVPTTTPLYMNQPTNPTFSQARPSMASTFSSQQPPPGMFQPGPSAHHQPPPSQFGWPNQQLQGGPNSHMNQSLLSLAANDQQNPNMSVPPPPNSFYSGNNDFHRQQPPSSTNPYYSGVPPVPSQTAGKPPNVNVQPTASVMAIQQQQQQQQQQHMASAAGANPGATGNASSTEAWQQYYQQYWQYMQLHQQAGVQPPPSQMTAQQQFQQSQTGSTAGAKPPGSNSMPTATNAQDPASAQASAEAWTQYWMQCQAYMQQQAQVPTSSNSTTIAASSQLYPQLSGKQQTQSSATSATNTSSSGSLPISNWQTWFNPKG